MNTDPEFTNRIALMASQIAHLGDGRSYMLQHKPGAQWVDLVEVNSTPLCDYGTRWWMQHRSTRVRAMPVKKTAAAK